VVDRQGRERVEIPLEDRFAFGKNWSRYLEHIDSERIAIAERSLVDNLGVELAGKRFFDIGCGSGLFSLAARNLGAEVVSLDFDPNSVGCATTLKFVHRPNDDAWTIVQGSVLDKEFMQGLGAFDIVYSWGVLHHTGRMWEAMDNAQSLVADQGILFISIYNDQGGYSDRWQTVKKMYVKMPLALQPAFAVAVLIFCEIKPTIGQLVRLKNPIKYWISGKKQSRGMSFWTDWVDWVGGYPFEVAKPDAVFDFCKERGFVLNKLKTVGGDSACNEYVFKKMNS
jgi:2-polyprenyl-6-hydroxyphenyl methylase/3-demethylubiquinone-9 3-methyltransferase